MWVKALVELGVVASFALFLSLVIVYLVRIVGFPQ